MNICFHGEIVVSYTSDVPIEFSFECRVANPNSVYLQAASMFKGPVPPVVPFSLGSLGFMTPFCILCFSKVLGYPFWHQMNQV